MPTIADIRKTVARWREHCREVQSLTTTAPRVSTESYVEKQKRIAYLRNDYNAFCEYYFAHFQRLYDKSTGELIKTVHNAPFHNEAAKLVIHNPNLKAVFKWPRGHAKSTHFDIFIPLWLMLQPKSLVNFMVIVGKSEDAARRLLGDIQSELEYNQRIVSDFGNQKPAVGNWIDGEFKTVGGVKFLAVGRGQSPRGLRDRDARPDYIVIDDLDDDELCRNPKRVRELTDWVKEALFGALDVGRGRFIMVGNLIAKNSVLYNIEHTAGVYVSQVNALDENGLPTWRDKWTVQEAKEYAEFVGYRAWQKEMMNNPIITGAIFRIDWIRYREVLPLCEYQMLVCYTDPSFKSTNNDFKASVLIGKRPDNSMDIIAAMVRQCSVAEMVTWLYDLYERTPEAAISFFMEANFMQDILLDEFYNEGTRRGYQLPIMPDKRKKPDKIARIETVSPLWERGLIYYNETEKNTNDFQALIEQTLAIEHGSRAHDDAPDACEGAIWLLQRDTRQKEQQPIFTPRHLHSTAW